ncbi:MAG: type II toxin-antitoxin system VapC family toxin [Acidobacteria bacterium]|nr:type II toxin-antitoxin system VapC family toxin [Acidobacteriota bacterium]
MGDDHARKGKPLTHYFIDSSALVKLFVAEAGSESIVQLVTEVDDQRKQVSALALIEVRSAIRRRQRAGDISDADADSSIAALVGESQRLLEHPVTAAIVEHASALVDRQDLRALDSLQLASAIVARDSMRGDDRLQFVTSDQKLLKAAQSEGFDVWDPQADT